jgi:heterodisulfide reductase subunit A2
MDNKAEPRVGVYICHCGGNISDVVDVKQVAAKAEELPNVVCARTHMFMCSDPGQQLIREDIETLGLNRVVVASCSPRLHELTFRAVLNRSGLNQYLYEHANIREQVSWVTHAHPDKATVKATRLVSAAVSKARLLEPLDPIRVDAKQHAVVIGGGVSGLKSALDLASYGISVTLIEKSPFLGGHMAQLDEVYPTEEDALKLLDSLIHEVSSNPNIELLTGAEIVEAGGYIGNFHLKVRQRPRGANFSPDKLGAVAAVCPVQVENEYDYGLTTRKAIYRSYEGCYPPAPAVDWQNCTRCGKCAAVVDGIDLNLEPVISNLTAGIIVAATGFEHYEPAEGEYGFRNLPQVITLPQLIRLMAEQKKDRPHANPLPWGEGALKWDGKPVRNVAFIHCVGSRQIEGIHEPREGQGLNEYCSRVCCTATLQAVNELKDSFSGTNVFDFYRDIRTYGRGHEEYYENASKKGALFFRFAPEEAPMVEQSTKGSDHPVTVRVKDRLTFGEELEVPVDLVVLAVGMVPRKVDDLVGMLKLPVGSDGYLLEVHPKLRPVEVAVNGVMLAGTSQGPKDITESAASASAAAVKAATILSKGFVDLDPYVAEVNADNCDGCGECISVCGYEGTLVLRDPTPGDGNHSAAEINGALCKGCGACVAVCPKDAIDLKGWTVDQYDAMVDAILAEDLVAEAAK